MGRFRFIKMHGLGNDFVVIDARVERQEITAARARAIADRHRGVGCDQLILLDPPPPGAKGVAATMRIFNPDGSEAEACGNASRCVATLLPAGARIATRGGELAAEVGAAGVTITLPPPRFDAASVHLAYPTDTAPLPMAWGDLADGWTVDVGNPHIVFVVADADAVPLATHGPEVEHDAIFTRGINVGVAEVTGPSALKLRVWERGAGLTQACGTGACAAAVAAIRRRLVNSPVEVTLPGGTLTIAWAGGDAPIRMTGPATRVFDGEADWAAFA